MTEVSMPKEIVLIAVDELIPYARNARTHPESQITQIAASIKEFGFRDPVEVTADKTIVAGHGRLLAARKLGLSHVPCVVHGDMTKSQWRAYNLVNNKLTDNSDWNPDLLKIELTDLKLDFDFQSLGFSLEDLGDSPDFEPGSEDEQGQLDEKKMVIMECPHCGEVFEKDQAKIKT